MLTRISIPGTRGWAGIVWDGGGILEWGAGVSVLCVQMPSREREAMEGRGDGRFSSMLDLTGLFTAFQEHYPQVGKAEVGSRAIPV